MDLDFTPEDLAFGQEVRAFIAENFDDEMRAKLAQSKNNHLDKESQVRWLKRLGEKGWIAPDWPVEYGGTGWGLGKKYVYDMEMALAGAPSTSNMGLRMCAPVVMAFGTPEQKAQHLPKILSTDVWWCQGYSEPGSGSDLASLALKAERDGDYYVLNGSKTWTTLAQWADWMFCLVRTSQEEIRQKGISFLLIDMKTPGITIRPIPTLDGPAEGEQEINETFFDNVRVPVSNLLGEEGGGFKVAMKTFDKSRPWIAAMATGVIRRALEESTAYALERKTFGVPIAQHQAIQFMLAEMAIAYESTRLLTHKAAWMVDKGDLSSIVSSYAKAYGADAAMRCTTDAVQIFGGYGYTKEYPVEKLMRDAKLLQIYEGTSQIQRVVIARNILGGK